MFCCIFNGMGRHKAGVREALFASHTYILEKAIEEVFATDLPVFCHRFASVLPPICQCFATVFPGMEGGHILNELVLSTYIKIMRDELKN